MCIEERNAIQLQRYRLRTFISSLGYSLVLNEFQHLSPLESHCHNVGSEQLFLLCLADDSQEIKCRGVNSAWLLHVASHNHW